MNISAQHVCAGRRDAPSALLTAAVDWTGDDPLPEIRAAFGEAPLALVSLFVTPRADFPAIMAAAARAFPGAKVTGCTTAGEIGPRGYVEDTIVAIGYPAADFAAETLLIAPLDPLDGQDAIDRVIRARIDLIERYPTFTGHFAFLLVDGMSRSEDVLAGTLAHATGGWPLFGGSAGDGVDFGRTYVSAGGQVFENAAVLSLVRTRHRVQVFSIDHLEPTEQRMVVTRADPAERIVKEINAAPAAREYARMVGKNPDELDRFTFASHPVAVRIGDSHHVRAIQQVNAEGELIFFAAIDEGMVLRVAHTRDIARHLDGALDELGLGGAPSDILACDCILRRLEAEQTQKARDLSDVLARHRVRGFSTYGEQFGALHVNQTMTGVALYPAEVP